MNQNRDPESMRNLLIGCVIVFCLIIGLACYRHFSASKKTSKTAWVRTPVASQTETFESRA
ncbi:hypothetical protein [Pseudoramibacter sp.]|jgi:hypothetical protein|uniref:hypothetical protein n=1 Tax=Pseudoramibacter sp. TaxID=2034862 RepID=UPI0025F8F8A6|nr:hypothetical protein [Pseudoramibacter sp.]MCH4072502.1 hypothetical protein [Pseudoramibacter sp.]MCH4106273.1 hypothetical protein [Pseudoramibacter sp.]